MRIPAFTYFVVLLIFYSCSNGKPKSSSNDLIDNDTNVIRNNEPKTVIGNSNYLDSVKKQILALEKKGVDSIKYPFSLDDVGTEGTEGTAYYVNDSLCKAEINIYTSMWRIDLTYYIGKTKINVEQKVYNIASEYTHKSEEKIKEFSYITDLNGMPLNKTDSGRVDVFQAFKEVVPFNLR